MTRGHPKKRELKKTTMATATKTSIQYIRAASKFIALIPSRLIRQMLAKSFEDEDIILKDCIWKEKKNVVVLCSRTPQPWNKGDIYTS